jgi:hypothetical protein
MIWYQILKECQNGWSMQLKLIKQGCLRKFLKVSQKVKESGNAQAEMAGKL